MRRTPPVALSLVFALVLVLALPLGAAAAPAQSQPPNPCVGTMERQPDGPTLMSIQGTHMTDDGYEKTEARLVAAAPNGSVYWVRDNSAAGRWWTYDVDPLPNGNVLLSTTEPGVTVVEELDATTGKPVSVTRYPNVSDAHDVDLINGDELVFADKGDYHNRVVVYNRTTQEVVWQYRFADHPDQFPRSGGGEYGKDWTHVNDVDQIAPGQFLVSLKNFNRVVVINRSTKEITLSLGSNDNRTIMNRQHNPEYLRGPDGRPTILVADSLNDRVVEYAKTGDGWTRTWQLVGGGLDEPRDADRLPNGNTLVADRKGHRVLEVTPQGRVVWEFYTPWQTYDAERYNLGDEPGGPTAQELGVTGTKRMVNSQNRSDAEIQDCAAYLNDFSGGGGQFFGVGGGGQGGDRPGGGGGGGVPLVPVAVVVAVVLVLGAVAAVVLRR
ncbi:MAG: aryl-sulfate sulfotransferase [Haloarculaceae archaeon]